MRWGRDHGGGETHRLERGRVPSGCTRPRWNCSPTPAWTCGTSRRWSSSAPPAPRWTAGACASPPGSSRRLWRRRRASGCSSRAAATPPRSYLRDGEVYFGTGSDVLYVRDLETGERRRARRDDVEGMAVALREAAADRLRHVDGPARGRPAARSTTWCRSSPCCGARASRCWSRRATARRSRACRQMAELCGEKESFGIYAMPSPPLMHDPDALTKVIGCAELAHPAHLRAGAQHGRHGPAQHHRRRRCSAMPRR